MRSNTPVKSSRSSSHPVAARLGVSASPAQTAAAGAGGIMARGIWQTLRLRVARVRELWPLTRLGAFVVGLSLAGLYVYGFEQLDLVWYVAAMAGLAMVAVCVVLVVLGALWMRRALTHAVPAQAGARVTELGFVSGFAVTRLRFWPLLETELAWRKPLAARLQPVVDGSRVGERVALTDHGELREVERKVTVRDVLGLSALSLRRRASVQWDVLPHRGALREVPWLSSLAGGDDIPHPMGVAAGDRLELRRYAPGDPARFIHWKAYARTRKLVVRMPERALSRALRTAAYLVAGQGDGASAAAALAAMESGAFGVDWVFGADGSETLAQAPAEVEAAVRRSPASRARGGSGLGSFIDRASEQGPVALMLFVPSSPGSWESPVMAAIRNSSQRPRVVIGVDALHEPAPRPLWRRVTLLTAREAGTAASEVRALVARLGAAGAEVWVAERAGGHLLGLEQLRARPAGSRAA